ncbi:ADP-ribosyltransferase exoenzyme [Mycobacteroides abscessus subsp. abscessus]|uniref:VG15 protein n=1 Tax=Mycobacteroides abscessus TaxID=36809 RepID=UPI0009265FD9|nr:ADP-ribosyltransferase [Mycobacteroides abscessus]SII41200.1 ADP-ribosyltransferase exoenzyme [Mycobacteroides abscessus subsp. abscessus]SIK13964.1 ADP-ribosyltransferase exoenzyme [Mycobacteroides abscessus subsp. abscessus]SIN25520.1 ADP-ribosyltransferase exoenzyme [Mycobacteroides abscessus subsp. abscessus]SLI51393.1 ADP-ribosyltransferase exoenzyme [Mycobacteroides abscessus subsp. abscessus]
MSTKDLVALYKKLEGDGATGQELLDAFKAVFPEVVQPYIEAASDVANQWYGELAPEEPYKPTAVAAIDAVPPARMLNSIEWAFRAAGQAHPLNRLVGSAQRMVFDGARETILTNADAEQVKYARLASPGACEFCRLMATRGAVYRSARSAQAGHDNCHCVPAVSRGKLHFQRPGYYQDWDDEYVMIVRQLDAENVKPTLNAVLSKMRANAEAASNSGSTLVEMSTKASDTKAVKVHAWLSAEKKHNEAVAAWLDAEKVFTKKKAKAAAQAKYMAKKKQAAADTQAWLDAEAKFKADLPAWLAAEKDFNKKQSKAAAQAKYVAKKKAVTLWLKAEDQYKATQAQLKAAADAAKAAAEKAAKANATVNVDLKKASKALAAAKHAAKKKGDLTKYDELSQMTPAEYAASKGQAVAPKVTTAATAPVSMPETAATAKVGTASTATKPKTIVGELTDSPDVLASTGQVLGTHGATVYTDSKGQKWLVKGPKNPSDQFLVNLDAASAELQAKSGLTTPATYIMTVDGKRQSVQFMFPGSANAFPGGVSLDKISSADMLTIQKHHALDWLMGNHDTHAGQFIRTGTGELIGIDKGQAFKFFGGDKLDWNYHPNAKHGTPEPIYNTLYRQYAEGKLGGSLIDPSTGPLAQYIAGLQAIPDKEFRNMFRPYAESAAKSGKLLVEAHGTVPTNDVDAFLDAIVARKASLADDLNAYYGKAAVARQKVLGVAKPTIVVSTTDKSGLAGASGGISDYLTPKFVGAQFVATPMATAEDLKKAGKALASAKYIAKKKGDTAKLAELSNLTPQLYWEQKNSVTTVITAPTATPATALAIDQQTQLAKWQSDFTAKFGTSGVFQPVKALAVQKGIKLSDAIPEFDKEFGIGVLSVEQMTNLMGFYGPAIQSKWITKYQDVVGEDQAQKVWKALAADGKTSFKEPPPPPKPVVIKKGTKYTPEREQPDQLVKSMTGKGLITDDTKPLGSEENPHIFAVNNANDWKTFGSKITPQEKSDWVAGQYDQTRIYTGSSYTSINAHVRADKEPTDKIKTFDKAFHGHNTFEEYTILSRGTHPTEFNDKNSLDAKFGFNSTLEELKVLEGETYVSKSYLSTSITTEPAFHNPVRILYKMKPGQRGLYVGGDTDGNFVTQHSGEREVILPRNQTLKVIEVRKSTSSFKADVIVEVVDQPV